MFRRLLFGLVMASLALPAMGRNIEPRTVKTPKRVNEGQGVVLLSLRSQEQLDGKLSVWFEAADDVAAQSAKHIRFERKQGVPLAGVNMIDSKPSAFAVPAGKWRLLAHVTKCEELPPPGTRCTVIGGAWSGDYPTGRYDGSSILLEVTPGALLNAGEVILEYPAGTDVAVPRKERVSLGMLMRLKWRPLSPNRVAALAAPFQVMPQRTMEGVTGVELSSITCGNDDAKINGGLTLPFDC